MAIKNCGECGGQVSDKAEKCPACGAPTRKKLGLIKLVLYGIGGLFTLVILVGIFGEPIEEKEPSAKAAEPPKRSAPAFVDVDIKEMLATYEGNELKGDQLFKGKKVRLTGKVDDVKNDILDRPFVTIGTGKQFEIPQVQCSLARSQAEKAAHLDKGEEITVVGEVTGLMMNVHLEKCVIQ